MTEVKTDHLGQKTGHDHDGIYEIPAENLKRLEEKIGKLARKADKLGLPAPELDIIGEGLVPVEKHNEGRAHYTETGLESGKKRKVYFVRVSGQSPIIEGWLLIAVIDHYSSLERGRNMIRRYPQETEIEIPEEYRTVRQRCDHCKTERRRNDTFLLSEVETGELKLVGRQCLKDFLGHKSPEALANYARFILDLMGAATDEDWGGNGWQDWYVELEPLLTTVAAVVREHGWLGRTKAREQGRADDASADRAIYSLTATKKEYKIPTTDEDRYLATQTILWTREVLANQDHLNDYEWNLVASTAYDELDWKNIGIAASAIFAYKKAHSLFEERKDENGEPVKRLGEDSEFQGEVGERLTLTLTVHEPMAFNSDNPYNDTTWLYRMTDEDGNLYVWWTSLDVLANKEDETITLKATVKEHKEYRGTNQTVLTRARLICPDCGKMKFKDHYYSWSERNQTDKRGYVYECGNCNPDPATLEAENELG